MLDGTKGLLDVQRLGQALSVAGSCVVRTKTINVGQERGISRKAYGGAVSQK
jgi:hypothetical protein